MNLAHADVLVEHLVEDVDLALIHVINRLAIGANGKIRVRADLLFQLARVGSLDVLIGLFALDIGLKADVDLLRLGVLHHEDRSESREKCAALYLEENHAMKTMPCTEWEGTVGNREKKLAMKGRMWRGRRIVERLMDEYKRRTLTRLCDEPPKRRKVKIQHRQVWPL